MTATQLEAVVPTTAATGKRKGAFSRVLRKPLGLSALIVLGLLILLAIIGPITTSHSAIYSSLDFINAPVGTPGWPLGADQNGHDIWARIVASMRVSLISAVIGAGVGIVLGSVFGLIAGYAGKRVDSVASWAFNLLMTFPSLILVIVLYPITGGAYQWTMFIFGFFLAPNIFRLVRNLVVGVRNELYVDAARVSGLSTHRILSRHILYVIRGPIIISAAFLASAAIGVQAGLAFLGFGSAAAPNFGGMTSDAFLNIYAHPIQLVWPSLFLALLSGSLVLLGNAYRDVLAAPQAKIKKQPTSTKKTAAPVEGSEPSSEQGGLLRVSDLWVRYPQSDGGTKDVVRGISLEVAAGEIVGLVGESGSGKTQTGFSILGLLPPEAQVNAAALDLAGDSLLTKNQSGLHSLRGSVIGYIPQEPMSNLDPSFTVGSQLVEGLAKSMSRREAKATVLQILARVGIADPVRTFKSYPHQISGGMAQRVLIAGAVATRPKLLIADEPTTALDVTVQAEILDLLRDLQGEYGMGVLLITHNFGIVADLCDRVLVMRSGELVESGDVRSIFHQPEHEYTQELIASILDEESVRTDALPVPTSMEETR